MEANDLLANFRADREAIEVILTIHYVLGDMTAQEALDEICHIIYPQSKPQSSGGKIGADD